MMNRYRDFDVNWRSGRRISLVSFEVIKMQNAELMGERARRGRIERAGEGRGEVG